MAEDPEDRAPTKVHIRGLDILKPHEIKAYVRHHCPDYTMERIEWIDDTSANLLFGSASAATSALEALATEPIGDVAQLPARQLHAAKAIPDRAEISLQIRPALVSDRKQAGAAQRSRFYLFNPEFDPEERHRRREESRRYRDRDGYRDGRTRRTREDEPRDHFDVNLYDDDPGALATRSHRSRSRSRPRQRRRRSLTPDSDREADRDLFSEQNRGKELFPLGGGGRLSSRRDRSASPARSRGRDQAMDGYSSDTSNARNRERARSLKRQRARDNGAKELFPDSGAGGGRLGDKVEDAADLVAKGISLPLMDGGDDVPSNGRSRKLEDRVTRPGSGARLADRITSAEDKNGAGDGDGEGSGGGINIRGLASQRNHQEGINIRGAASKTARELFPSKLGNDNPNAGKELFADGGRSAGRPRHRQRAGDLFD